MKLHYLLFSLRLRLTKSRRVREIEIEKWFEGLSPVGVTPFEALATYRTRASIDDCDFFGHLSNSSYMKVLDAARAKAALAFMPSLLRAGGRISLGASNFHFIREIPPFSSYEVRLTTLAWDNQWVYVVGRFVTYQKPRKSQKIVGPSSSLSSDTSIPTHKNLSDSTSSSSDGLSVKNTLATAQISQDEPDGATLHCLSISQHCFKIGRTTIPPTIIMACEGLSGPSPSPEPYSHTNPPPHWEKVRAMCSKLHGGSVEKFRAFIRGGWREVPDGEQWWEDALSGMMEEKRTTNLEVLHKLKTAMEGARRMY